MFSKNYDKILPSSIVNPVNLFYWLHRVRDEVDMGLGYEKLIRLITRIAYRMITAEMKKQLALFISVGNP